YRDLADGRWLTPDPIEERGGQNVRAFVVNDPVNNVDALGLLKFVGCSADQTNELTDEFKNYCAKLPSALPGCCRAKTILPRLQYLCNNNDDITIKCESRKTGGCSGPNTCAWSL